MLGIWPADAPPWPSSSSSPRSVLRAPLCCAWIKDNLAGLGRGAGREPGSCPSLIYFARNQEAFVERSLPAVFLSTWAVMNHLMGKYSLQTPWAVFLEQTRRSLLMFHVSPDTSTQFGYYHPMFSSPILPLIALGFGFAVRGVAQPGRGPWPLSSGCSTFSSAAS